MGLWWLTRMFMLLVRIRRHGVLRGRGGDVNGKDKTAKARRSIQRHKTKKWNITRKLKHGEQTWTLLFMLGNRKTRIEMDLQKHAAWRPFYTGWIPGSLIMKLITVTYLFIFPRALLLEFCFLLWSKQHFTVS